MTLHTALGWLRGNKSNFKLSKDTHSSPSLVSYGISIVMIVEKFDRVIMTPHCIANLLTEMETTLITEWPRDAGWTSTYESSIGVLKAGTALVTWLWLARLLSHWNISVLKQLTKSCHLKEFKLLSYACFTQSSPAVIFIRPRGTQVIVWWTMASIKNCGMKIFSFKVLNNIPMNWGVLRYETIFELSSLSLCFLGKHSTQWSRITMAATLQTLCLTHLPLTKCPPFWQTTISNALFWMKMIEFQFEFHWNLFQRVQLTISQHWFR